MKRRDAIVAATSGFVAAFLAVRVGRGEHAERLTWNNWSRMCDHVGVGPDHTRQPHGCWVDDEGRPSRYPGRHDRLGLLFPDGRLAVQGDWIVRRSNGSIEILR